jgi:hypothetical protein
MTDGTSSIVSGFVQMAAAGSDDLIGHAQMGQPQRLGELCIRLDGAQIVFHLPHGEGYANSHRFYSLL